MKPTPAKSLRPSFLVPKKLCLFMSLTECVPSPLPLPLPLPLPPSFLFMSLILSFAVSSQLGASSEDQEIFFDFRKQRFIYSNETQTFSKLPYPTKQPFGYYLKSTGHGTEAKVALATDKWGRNVWVTFFNLFSFLYTATFRIGLMFAASALFFFGELDLIIRNRRSRN